MSIGVFMSVLFKGVKWFWTRGKFRNSSMLVRFVFAKLMFGLIYRCYGFILYFIY